MRQTSLFDKPQVDLSKTSFDGSDYKPERDDVRLSGQVKRIFNLMKDGAWRTLPEIEANTKDPQASISAQLRHLRKRRFGEHTVEKRLRDDISDGLYEYKLIVNPNVIVL